jgi:uncharacterized protein (DUF1810 family)
MTSQPKSEPFDLDRFVSAQAPVYEAVLAELRQGRKQTHWIWFVFPQVEGLGSSATARHFAIKSRAEAGAYLAHPILGARLLECTETVLAHSRKLAHEIFGSPDGLKFCSSMTLFERAGGGPAFGRALDQFFNGKRDARTLAVFDNWPKP